MSMPPNHPPVSGAGTGPAPSAAPMSASTVPTPPHWEPQPLAQMRQASFLVRGENGATADISLVTLGPSSGDVLDNVNRWLGQLGQPPLTAEQLPQVVQHLPGDLGHVAIVDLGRQTGARRSEQGWTHHCGHRSRGDRDSLLQTPRQSGPGWRGEGKLFEMGRCQPE